VLPRTGAGLLLADIWVISMGFTLDKVVPWGRSYEEYVAMFGLTEADLTLRILGCGDGPAGFNAELTRRARTVVSVDPLYRFDASQIRGRIHETYEAVPIAYA